jgi:hypothetical protein
VMKNVCEEIRNGFESGMGSIPMNLLLFGY